MIAEDDAPLVQRSLEGDRAAFGELVGKYQQVLFNAALRMSNDREDARDAVQTAFLKAWRKLHTFDRRNKFFSWIYRIVVNETLNLIRDRRPQVLLDERMVSPERSPEDQAETAELGAIVQDGLMELQMEYREVIVLRHFLQMSHCEIGGLLNLPEKTVKSRLYTARQLLGGILGRHGMGTI